MNSKLIGSLCGMTMLALGVTAQAAETKAKSDTATAPAATPAEQPKPAKAKMSAEELAGLSGGKTVVTALTNQDLTAINTGNTITATTVGSGNISLSGGALANFSGVGNFVMNTGHNNNLQSSMSVTVIMAPAAP